MSDKTITAQSDKLVERARQILAGKPPEIVGAALAELMAILLAGHAPGLRDEVQAHLFKLVDDLIPLMIAQMTDEGRYPAEWAEADAEADARKERLQ